MDPIYSTQGRPQNLSSQGGHGVQERPGGASVVEQVKDKASDLKDKASDLIDKAKERASQAADTVKDKYDDLGERIQEGGEFIRDRATEGAEQLTSLIRKNPIPALLVSFCAGFFLCRMLKD